MPSVLEITLTGLCVLVVQGAENEPNPAAVKALVVHAPTRTHVDPDLIRHVPKLSFRAEHYQNGEIDHYPVSIGPEGDELVNLVIPVDDQVTIEWEEGKALEELFTLDWDGEDSMEMAPPLGHLGIDQIVQTGNAIAATVSLPFGRLETRRLIKDSGNAVRWRFGQGGPVQAVADHMTLVSTAKKGASVILTLAGKSHILQAPEGETLQISLTNLPPNAPLKRRSFESVHIGHLKWYGTISNKPTEVILPTPEAGSPATRQGGFCPSVRMHVSE